MCPLLAIQKDSNEIAMCFSLAPIEGSGLNIKVIYLLGAPIDVSDARLGDKDGHSLLSVMAAVINDSEVRHAGTGTGTERNVENTPSGRSSSQRLASRRVKRDSRRLRDLYRKSEKRTLLKRPRPISWRHHRIANGANSHRFGRLKFIAPSGGPINGVGIDQQPVFVSARHFC